MSKVAVVKDLEDRRRGLARALGLIEDDILANLHGKPRILIKPNFVSAYSYLSATPVECVEEIVKLLLSLTNVKEIVLAETPTIGSFREAIERFGYKMLKDTYGVELCDLDGYGFDEVEVVDGMGRSFTIPVSKLVMDADFRISAVRPKTHDVVVVTLTIKNIVVGSIKSGSRHLIHQGYWQINYNIAKIATYVIPHLAVVDGFEAMEGDGPVKGRPRKWGVYFASTNPVSLDSIVAYAMGFDVYDVGYLYILSLWGYGEINPDRIGLIGDPLVEVATTFKPHRRFREQLRWRDHIDTIMKLPRGLRASAS